MPDTPSTPPPLIRAGRSPLIGRSRQLALLAEHLAEAQAGRPVIVLLAGAPGIGKTRLLEEFPVAGTAEGMTVLRGGASQAESMPPYLPFLEALGEYIASAPTERLREQAGTGAASLATLFPEIPARLGPLPSTPPLGPEQERFRLYEAVAGFLTAVATPAPLVLLLDDLQWADAATFDLLVHIAGRVRSAALLIVGACREGEAAENPAFVRALAELNRQRRLVTLPLNSLEAEESRALAASMLRGEIEPNAADLLHRQSAGNPFFLEELLRALVEDGTLIWQEGHWELRTRPNRLLPPRVAEAIQMRLARLDPTVVELLRVAAVAGRTFEPALLAKAMGGDVEQAEELLLAAERAQIVRADVTGAYVFTHDLVRETLDAGVGSARRKRLHLAIGEALEAQGDAEAPQRLADLAFHFAEAGASTRGVRYALAAGRQALRASAAADAMAHYRTAVRLLDTSGESDPEQQATALSGLGDAATVAGDYPQASDAYHEAQAIWLRTGNTAAAAQAWHELGRVRWRQEAVAGARDAFERALDLLGPEDSPGAAETLLQLADLYVTSFGRNSEGTAYAERALAMVERLGDRHLEARACCVLGNIKGRGNELATGQALLERALSLARALDDPALGAEACAYLANLYAWMGDLERSRAVSFLRAEFAARTHDMFHLRHVFSWIGFQEMLQGRWSEAEERFAEQEQILEGHQSPEPRAVLHAYRGLLRYFQGRFSEGDQELGHGLDLLRPTGSGAHVWYLGWRGQILAELGRRDEALACFTELQALAGTLDAPARARGNALAQVAVGYARLGARELAASCYPQLLPFRGQLSPILIDRGLGVAALAAGDVAAARRHLADAEAQARQAGMRPELALILLQRGVLDRDHGTGRVERPAIADGPLAEGLRLCAEIGMQELGRRMLGPAPGIPGRRHNRGPRIAGLSDRELEVLRLVTEGRTNRDIAEALFLSEKTVARHLTSIYTKTGVENRAGAAAFALRHGLA